MAQGTIHVDYELVQKVAQRFQQQAEACSAMMRRLQQRASELEEGGWSGQAANAFFDELNHETLPALQRLAASFHDSSEVTGKISQVFREAEFEAVGLIQRDAPEETSPSTTSRPTVDGKSEELQNGADSKPSSSLLETFLSIYHTASKVDTVVGFASVFAKEGVGAGWAPPKVLEFLKSNPYLTRAGQGLAAVGFGANLAKFADDPSVESGADLGSSGLGLYGAFFSGPVASLSGAFAGGYAIGSTFIAPHTTEPLSNALSNWDPLDLGYSPGNYPRTTIRDYERSGKPMPMDVAGDVLSGLYKSSRKEAAQFAEQYSERNGISAREFYRKSGMWWMQPGVWPQF